MAVGIRDRFSLALERTCWALGISPPRADSSAAGRYGEWLGRKFLKTKDFSILSANWRCPWDRRLEIDLVCRKDGILVFVEIRARSDRALVNGFHSINGRKRKTLRKAFLAYLSRARPSPRNYRFDVIEVDLPSAEEGKPRIFHHENVAIFA